MLYVLDEPSIGLHQRDNDKLIATLKHLRDLKNTVLVVEHDEDTMRAADYLIDIGPGAGVNGGKVVAAGTPEEVMKNENSLTGRYLSGKETIPTPKKRRKAKRGEPILKLIAGQRYRLTEPNLFALIRSGKFEAYAVTQRKSSFRQIFLMTLEKDCAAYPSMDEFGQIDVMLYAVEDSEIEMLEFSALDPQQNYRLMSRWFAELIKLPWLRLMADKGDDVLQTWVDGSALSDSLDDNDALVFDFEDNESTFSMLLGIRFQAEDKKLSKRLAIRNQHQKRLLSTAIDNLLGRESPIDSSVGDGSSLEHTAFIVSVAAKALGMPTANIKLSAEIVRKLDQIGIIRRLVQKANMQLRLITLVPDWWSKDSGVMIGYYGEKKELVAIVPADVDRYKLITAKHPEGIAVDAGVASQLDNSAFVCYAGFPARKLSVMDLFKFMFNQCWRVDYRTIMFASFVAGLIPLITPIITESIFQDIIPILDRQGLATVTQVSIVSSFTLAAISIVRSVAVLRITTHLDMATEAALWSRLLTLPTKFFRRFQSGELAQRMGGLQAIKQLISGEFVSTVFNILFSFWSLMLMCWYSMKLTATAFVIWAVYCAIMILIYRRVVGFQTHLIEAKNKTAGIVQQIFNGLPKFRIQGAEEQAYWLWAKAFGDEWKWNKRLRWQNNYSSIISGMQPMLLTMILYYVAFSSNNNPSGGGIGYAQFIAFSAAFTSFNATVNSFIPLIGQIFSIKPHIENLRPILEAEPEVAEDRIDADVLSGAIEVNHITFAYNENLPDVLHDVSFHIAAGENVAIVGKSGCGKSTLIRLLLGFEEPKQGAVYYDGQDLAELSLSSVRSQMGVVLQNGQLMSGDIFTNIVGTTALTMQDAWEAAEAAGIADDIRKMPMGMQTVISEGSSNISGGQRQRILIARALAAKPSILIFDEATSALDNRTQAIVTESLNKRHVTRIVVAHRLSTIRDCDRILVMDRGRLVEQGSFDELVEQGGLFAGLVKRQVA